MVILNGVTKQEYAIKQRVQVGENELIFKTSRMENLKGAIFTGIALQSCSR